VSRVGNTRERCTDGAASVEKVRLDQWLWAARWYRNRSLAVAACRGGHVKIDKDSCKPSRSVRVGEVIRIHKGQREYIVHVIGLSSRRGPASEARLLYEDLTPPEEVDPHSGQSAIRGGERPTKRDRRRRGKIEGW
jgi:ribosome-associated heat shock protein Hsp15